METWQLLLSRIPGKVPSAHQMTSKTIAWNVADGIGYGLKIDPVTGAKTVVPIGLGLDGVDGITPHIGPNGNWWIGDFDTGVTAQGDRNYVHSQGSALISWVINHNLGKYPSVTVTDSAGTEVECEVQHTDINSLILNFSEPFAGSAYLN